MQRVFIHFSFYNMTIILKSIVYLGSYVYDIDGKKYLDFISGIAVTSTGRKILSI